MLGMHPCSKCILLLSGVMFCVVELVAVCLLVRFVILPSTVLQLDIAAASLLQAHCLCAYMHCSCLSGDEDNQFRPSYNSTYQLTYISCCSKSGEAATSICAV